MVSSRAITQQKNHQVKMSLTSANKNKMKETDSLSKRENQVVHLLAEGFPKQKIAESLSITKNTVATHVSHIYRKLRVSNTHGAVGIAYRCGILSLD